MDAIVLAGGLGTRLRSVVADLPKPMAPVAGRPFLEILLALLARKGVTRAVLALGYKADTIVSHFGTRYHGIDLVYSIEDMPLGTGGALRAALAKCRAEGVLVANGDTYLDLDVDALYANWHRAKCPQIVGRQVEDTGRFGRLIVAENRVLGFAAKGASGPGIINLGHYLLPRTLFDRFELPEAFSFESDFLAPRIPEMQFELTLAPGRFIDIGVPEDFQRAQTELAGDV